MMVVAGISCGKSRVEYLVSYLPLLKELVMLLVLAPAKVAFAG